MNNLYSWNIENGGAAFRLRRLCIPLSLLKVIVADDLVVAAYTGQLRPLTQADNEQSYLPAQHRPGWHHSPGWLQVVVGGDRSQGNILIRSKTRLKEKNFTRVFTHIYESISIYVLKTLIGDRRSEPLRAARNDLENLIHDPGPTFGQDDDGPTDDWHCDTRFVTAAY